MFPQGSVGSTVDSDALFISSSHVLCYADAKHSAEQVRLQIAVPGFAASDMLPLVYYAPLNASRVYPSPSPSCQGYVTVSGTDFTDFGNLSCKFGEVPTNGSLVSHSKVICNTPCLDQQGPSSIYLTQNGFDYEDTGLTWSHQFMPAHLTLFPTWGPVHGGSLVTLKGDFPVIDDEVECQFETARVLAIFETYSTITCYVPRHAAGSVTVSVIAGDAAIQQGSNAAEFEYREEMSISLLQPASGIKGTLTTVSAVGTGFTPEPVFCAFANVQVQASYFSSSLIKCNAPKIQQLGAVSFTLLSMDSSNHSYPVATEGAIVFEVLAPAPALQIIPSVGPVIGGTRITLLGWNLVDDRVIACIFGRQVVPARHLANDAPTCTTSVFVDVGNTTVAVQTERRGVIPQMSGYLVTAASQIRIYPSLGPLQGGHLVTLVGQSFDQARGFVCYFGNYSSSAYFVTSSQLSCQAAPQQAGTVQVNVALLDDTGRDLTDGSPINYTYTPAPLLLYLEPSVGPSAGGFEVRVVSLDSMWDYPAECLFGNVSASISAKEDGVYRKCTAPTMAPQKLSVWLYWPSVGMLSNGLEFVPRQMSRVLSVHPTVLRTLGGTVMTVFLNTDDPPAAPQCMFGDTNITAMWYRASKWQAAKLVCVAPAHAAGAIMLELTADGLALDNGRIPLLYRELIAILELRPSRGAMAGGNTVMFRVHPPAAYTPVLCSFGSGGEAKLVQATQISSGSMMCTVPPTSQPGAVSLTLIGHGINISAEVVRYMYDCSPSVLALQPNFGIPGVHSVVTVIGEHFVESETLACRFGAAKAVARWINSSRIACLVPLEWIDTSVVEVSINGVDFTWDGVVLSARDPLTISSFWPGIVVAGSRRIITIYGGPFAHETAHLCVFGREPPVPAHVINAQHLECASSAFSAGNFSVAVAVDGVSIEAAPLLLQVVPSWQVISIFPAFALVNDSRPVTLFGHGFISMTCLRCRFQGGHLTHVSEATVRQSNEVLCEYPVLPAPTLRMLVLSCDEVPLSDPVRFEYRQC